MYGSDYYAGSVDTDYGMKNGGVTQVRNAGGPGWSSHDEIWYNPKSTEEFPNGSYVI